MTTFLFALILWFQPIQDYKVMSIVSVSNGVMIAAPTEDKTTLHIRSAYFYIQYDDSTRSNFVIISENVREDDTIYICEDRGQRSIGVLHNKEAFVLYYSDERYLILYLK